MEQAIDFRSNHWPVVSNYILSTPNTLSGKQFKRCHVNWSPSELWCPRVGELLVNWHRLLANAVSLLCESLTFKTTSKTCSGSVANTWTLTGDDR